MLSNSIVTLQLPNPQNTMYRSTQELNTLCDDMNNNLRIMVRSHSVSPFTEINSKVVSPSIIRQIIVPNSRSNIFSESSLSNGFSKILYKSVPYAKIQRRAYSRYPDSKLEYLNVLPSGFISQSGFLDDEIINSRFILRKTPTIIRRVTRYIVPRQVAYEDVKKSNIYQDFDYETSTWPRNWSSLSINDVDNGNLRGSTFEDVRRRLKNLSLKIDSLKETAENRAYLKNDIYVAYPLKNDRHSNGCYEFMKPSIRMCYPNSSNTSEIRGKLRRLLCRSKNDPHYYQY